MLVIMATDKWQVASNILFSQLEPKNKSMYNEKLNCHYSFACNAQIIPGQTDPSTL